MNFKEILLTFFILFVGLCSLCIVLYYAIKLLNLVLRLTQALFDMLLRRPFDAFCNLFKHSKASPSYSVINTEEESVVAQESMEREMTFIINKPNKKIETISTDHPYYNGLVNFTPMFWQLEGDTVRKLIPLDVIKWTWVDATEKFNLMMHTLKSVSALAIDVEHHNHRSFKGVVCLVQISISTEDFIVDAMCLKNELRRLNEVTSDRSYLKVLHGAKNDIEWLQRDFGVYIVNMFDTQKAASELQEERTGLYFLLNKYCGVEMGEESREFYQRFDWRRRPLSNDMMRYARQDAHYLLYLHDLFRERLLSRWYRGKDDLLRVYSGSTGLCGILYQEPSYSHLSCYKKIKGQLNEQQMECFRLLYELRLGVCKREDESMGYVLPNNILMEISKTLPRSREDVISCCYQDKPLPYLVQNCIQGIIRNVEQAIVDVP